MNQLEQLKQFTTVVADTGDFQSIQAYTPRDATTNPSLILKAVQKDEYKPLLEKAVRDNLDRSIPDTIDHLLVAFGSRSCASSRAACRPRSTPACRSTSRARWPRAAT